MELNRLDYARWVLERNLHWIAAVEAKTAVIVSVTTAMLGALAVAFSPLKLAEISLWTGVVSVLAACFLSASIILGALAVWPQTDGPPTSFIFFGKIKNLSAVEYRESFLASDEASLLGDCLAQIHRNAEIACLKYGRVAASMKCAFISLLPWIIALAKLVSEKQ